MWLGFASCFHLHRPLRLLSRSLVYNRAHLVFIGKINNCRAYLRTKRAFPLKSQLSDNTDTIRGTVESQQENNSTIGMSTVKKQRAKSEYKQDKIAVCDLLFNVSTILPLFISFCR